MAPECKREERSVLYVLLKMFVNASSARLRTTTRMLILKVSIQNIGLHTCKCP